jgi:hypothetical protein
MLGDRSNRDRCSMGFGKQIEAARSSALPGSALAKACNCTLTLWERLNRFLEHPELELSNDLAENSMRPVAIRRRNWIHIGSPKAGPKSATTLSVVESCRRLKLPVRNYLASVLLGLADLPIQRLPELIPATWASARLVPQIGVQLFEVESFISGRVAA